MTFMSLFAYVNAMHAFSRHFYSNFLLNLLHQSSNKSPYGVLRTLPAVLRVISGQSCVFIYGTCYCAKYTWVVTGTTTLQPFLLLICTVCRFRISKKQFSEPVLSLSSRFCSRIFNTLPPGPHLSPGQLKSYSPLCSLCRPPLRQELISVTFERESVHYLFILNSFLYLHI